MLIGFFVSVACNDFYTVHIFYSQSECKTCQSENDQGQEKSPTAWRLWLSIQHGFGPKNIKKPNALIQSMKENLFAWFVFWRSDFFVLLILHGSINFCIIIFCQCQSNWVCFINWFYARWFAQGLICFKTNFVIFQSRSVREELFRLVGRKINIFWLEDEIDSFDSKISVSDFHFFYQSDNINFLLCGLNNVIGFVTG